MDYILLGIKMDKIKIKTSGISTIFLNQNQVEFLLKCIYITQETQSMKPNKSEAEVIRELTRIQQNNEDKVIGMVMK